MTRQSRRAAERRGRARSALTRAARLGDRAATVGFDWSDPSGALDKVREEVEEVAQCLDDPAHAARVEEELGDLLFAACMVARKARVDPDRALRRANHKFVTRFARMEALLLEAGLTCQHATLDQMEACWQRAKREGG